MRNKDMAAANAERRRLAADPERIRQRFLKKVRQDEVYGGCWMWIGARLADGSYGVFWMLGGQVGAHQASHQIFKGEVPEGMVVMHSCDNRWCVNPAHLTPGTPTENMRDMVTKGRHVCGTAMLTKEQVATLKAEYVKRDGELGRLSRKYGIRVASVHAIVSGRNWKDVEPAGIAGPTEFFSQRARGAAHHKAKLTEDDVRAIRAAHVAGDDLATIAEKFAISKPTASEIIRRKTWRHVQ